MLFSKETSSLTILFVRNGIYLTTKKTYLFCEPVKCDSSFCKKLWKDCYVHCKKEIFHVNKRQFIIFFIFHLFFTYGKKLQKKTKNLQEKLAQHVILQGGKLLYG